jgi:hypothetical protein
VNISKKVGELCAPNTVSAQQVQALPAVAVLVDAPYWVLGTDYDNYAVVWSCSNFGLFSTREYIFKHKAAISLVC